MSQKYQKEWSETLKRTVWLVETPGISFKGDTLSDQYNITRILKMRGTKRKIFYERLVYIIRSIFFKKSMDPKPFESYLKSINKKHINDATIYRDLKEIYQKIVQPEKNKFARGSNRANKILDLLQKSNSPCIEKYLDYGCGSGELTRSIGESLGLKMTQIYGVDIIKYSGIYGFEFSQIQDGKIQHENDSFDLITVSMVLHHITDKNLTVTINELFRVLKPNGVLILREHHVPKETTTEMHIVLDFMHDIYDDVLSSDTSWKETGEYYAKYRSQNEWDTILSKVGFSLNSFQPRYNPDYQKNPISQYMRIYNKSSWETILAPPRHESYSRIPFFRTLTDKIPRVKYRRRNREIKNNLHWGQRKLLLSEIELITMFYGTETYKKNSKKKLYIIYAGSAPGTHIKYLWRLFPEVYFVLYDPRDFDPILDDAQTDHIQTHVQLFLDETAQEWRSVDHPDKHIILVSDIRTAEPDTMKPEEVEKHIRQDNQLQKQWYQIMEPAVAMFKFRLPWDEEQTEYPRGDIFLQIFPPLTSTETRLIVWEPNAPTKIYDHKEYEERMFRFNTTERSYEYDNPLQGLHEDEKEGLNNQYDSVGEINIIEKYLRLKNKNYAPREIVKISRTISKKLSNSRTLESEQPLKKYSRNIVKTLKEMGEIPKDAPYTRKTYHEYVIANYDKYVNMGVLDPNKDEGGILVKL